MLCTNSDSLEMVAAKAVDELLQMTAYTNRPVYAPHIRQIGIWLQEALDRRPPAVSVTTPMRLDVATFAARMTEIMNLKDTEKGFAVVDGKPTYDAVKALTGMQHQFNRIQEHGIFNNKDELRRILIHIANFAMLAELCL